MKHEFIHATDGAWVAFAEGEYLFSSDNRWLGVIRSGEVYNVDGEHVGFVDAHQRLVRHSTPRLKQRIARPVAPLAARTPLPPKRALFAPPLPPSLEEVFHALPRPLTRLVPLARLLEVDALVGCEIRAADGTFLGRIARDEEQDAIGFRRGPFGDPASTLSIFNPGARYGAFRSPLSAYDPEADPPTLVRGDSPVAVLSVGPHRDTRVDPNELVAWVARA